MEKWSIFHGGLAFLYKDESEWLETHVPCQPHPLETANIFATSMKVGPVASWRGKWISKLRLIVVVTRTVKQWKAMPTAKTRVAKNALPRVMELRKEDVVDESYWCIIMCWRCTWGPRTRLIQFDNGIK